MCSVILTLRLRLLCRPLRFMTTRVTRSQCKIAGDNCLTGETVEEAHDRKPEIKMTEPLAPSTSEAGVVNVANKLSTYPIERYSGKVDEDVNKFIQQYKTLVSVYAWSNADSGKAFRVTNLGHSRTLGNQHITALDLRKG